MSELWPKYCRWCGSELVLEKRVQFGYRWGHCPKTLLGAVGLGSGKHDTSVMMGLAKKMAPKWKYNAFTGEKIDD